MKHTPGPWTVKSDRISIQVAAADDDVSICELWRRGNHELELANANLMAAAPDLLEALEDLVDEYGVAVSTEKVKAAIAKARGI
jgi:hypothetical protein